MKVTRIEYWRLLFTMNAASPAAHGGYVNWMRLFRSRKSWKIGKVDVFRLAAFPTPFTPSPYRMHIDAAPYGSPYAKLINERCQWKRLTDHQMGKMS